ncbi:unnamed protein product [Prorocentrum cordatum]|uniref:Poly(A) RNA polymerase mitochondrial-like central palm domain-containing protein n=1 Tax=Prorocentrum cordatum TaxID=2364126 RepID=A0ABN9T641_9DINO|nr:unnamed protein product [Polarella glacialis]
MDTAVQRWGGARVSPGWPQAPPRVTLGLACRQLALDPLLEPFRFSRSLVTSRRRFLDRWPRPARTMAVPWQGVASHGAAAPPRAGASSVAQHLMRSLFHAMPQAEEQQLFRDCERELVAALGSLGPDWRLAPFGSAKNLLMTRGSDLDITAYRADLLGGGGAALAAPDLEERLLPLLRSSGRLEIQGNVMRARIPVLKMRFDGILDVDLSCHNVEALRNTQLLRAYAELDPVVRNLVVLVKLWAKAEGVCGAPSGHLTSYALTLMVVYFLQVHPRMCMPCLPTHLFTGFGCKPPEVQQTRWACTVPIQEALLCFFHFYSSEFQWGQEVVAARLGWRSTADDPEHCRLPAAHLLRLHVEDPFLLNRNLNCVLGAEQEKKLYVALSRATADMYRGFAPVGLRGEQPVDAPLRPFPRAEEPKDTAHDTRGDSAESTAAGPYSEYSTENGSDKDLDRGVPASPCAPAGPGWGCGVSSALAPAAESLDRSAPAGPCTQPRPGRGRRTGCALAPSAEDWAVASAPARQGCGGCQAPAAAEAWGHGPPAPAAPVPARSGWDGRAAPATGLWDQDPPAAAAPAPACPGRAAPGIGPYQGPSTAAATASDRLGQDGRPVAAVGPRGRRPSAPASPAPTRPGWDSRAALPIGQRDQWPPAPAGAAPARQGCGAGSGKPYTGVSWAPEPPLRDPQTRCHLQQAPHATQSHATSDQPWRRPISAAGTGAGPPQPQAPQPRPRAAQPRAPPPLAQSQQAPQPHELPPTTLGFLRL